jgi:hypothetical protein
VGEGAVQLENGHPALRLSLPSRCKMPLGLMVIFMMLVVISVLGVLGYVMDRQVDRDQRNCERK